MIGVKLNLDFFSEVVLISFSLVLPSLFFPTTVRFVSLLGDGSDGHGQVSISLVSSFNSPLSKFNTYYTF